MATDPESQTKSVSKTDTCWQLFEISIYIMKLLWIILSVYLLAAQTNIVIMIEIIIIIKSLLLISAFIIREIDSRTKKINCGSIYLFICMHYFFYICAVVTLFIRMIVALGMRELKNEIEYISVLVYMSTETILIIIMLIMCKVAM